MVSLWRAVLSFQLSFLLFFYSVHQFWRDCVHVAGFALLDDLYGFGAVEEAVNGARSGLLEVLVVLPVVFCFLEPVLAQLGVAGDVVHSFVIGKYGNDLVVNFTAVIELHDADDPGFHERAWYQRLGHPDDLDIERVAILIPSPGNGSVGEGVGQRGIADSIKLEVAGFGDQLVLVDGIAVQLDDRVQPQLGFIGKGRQHVQQVEHRAARSVVDVRHWCNGLKS